MPDADKFIETTFPSIHDAFMAFADRLTNYRVLAAQEVHMQIIALVVVLVVVFKMLIDYKPLNKRIEERDNDPNNTIKSNKWYENNK